MDASTQTAPALGETGSVAGMGHGATTLGTAATHLAQARADLDRVAAGMDARVAGLRGRWVGAGGSAFFAFEQAWLQRQQRIVAALDGLQDALRRTEQHDRAVDEQQSDAYRAQAARLDAR